MARAEYRLDDGGEVVREGGREGGDGGEGWMDGQPVVAEAGQEQGTAESRTMGSQAHSCRLPAANRR